MKLLLDRSEYGDKSTTGDLYVDGVWECATLEDGLQPDDVKVAGETCIPAGTYQVLVTISPKFKRLLPLLVGVPGFDGIRIHPGNSVGDTAGCLLVGEKIETVAGMPFLTNSRAAFDRLFPRLLNAQDTGDSISIEVQA